MADNIVDLELDIVDNSPEIISALNGAIATALELCGIQAEAYAKLNVTDTAKSGVDLTGYEKDNSRVDTGRLRNSITHTVIDDTVYIGSNLEYAVYNELGTGIYASQPGGRQSPWGYYDRKGNYHVTKGMKPIHFLRNALADNVPVYVKIVTDVLKENN